MTLDPMLIFEIKTVTKCKHEKNYKNVPLWLNLKNRYILAQLTKKILIK